MRKSRLNIFAFGLNVNLLEEKNNNYKYNNLNLES